MSTARRFDHHAPGLSAMDKVYAACSDPANYSLGQVADGYLPHRKAGRQRAYPSAIHLINMQGICAFASGPQYFRYINRPSVWQEFRRIAKRVSDLDLPDKAPDAESTRTWRGQIAPRRKEDDPAAFEHSSEALEALIHAQAQLGAQRACQLAGPTAQQDFNPLDPALARLVIVDGTVSAPFSRVTTITGPDGDEIVLPVRDRKGSPRMQRIVHHVTKDGRRHSGINHVAAIVDTPFGWVNVGVGRALHGENIAALHVIGRAARYAPGLIKGVLSDRVLAGWPERLLLREHGLVVYHLPGAAQALSDEEQAARLHAQGLLHERGINLGMESTAVKDLARLELEGTFNPAAPLPLGKSVHRNSRGQLVYVNSVGIPLDIISHEPPGAPTHEHAMYVDDAGLHEVNYMHGKLHKTQQALCTSARVVTDVDGGHALQSAWRLECPHGTMPIELSWAPTAAECRPDGSPRPDRQRALERLALSGRDLGGPAHVHGLRSRIEAYFSGYDASQARGGGFATYLDLDHQLMGFFAYGQLTSACTLHVSRFGVDER